MLQTVRPQELQDKSERMASSAQTFAGRSHELRRRNMRRNLMLGALIFGVRAGFSAGQANLPVCAAAEAAGGVEL